MDRKVAGALVSAIALLVAPPSTYAQSRSAPLDGAPGRVVEIRSYNLKPGTRARFQSLFEREALPMLRRWNVDVVAYGPSLHDKDSFYLMRGFPGVDERQRSEDAFYGSDEWRKGPREAILADIDSYTTVVIEVDEATLRGLRRTSPFDSLALAQGKPVSAGKEKAMETKTAPGSDLAELIELNDHYIRSVQNSDVRRFREILADDFLCSLPDGSLVDRDRFLEQTAKPVTISNLQAHDVKVRLMGDFAIVHARTTYTAADGRSASGRYTDVWARRGDRWLAVSAHVTRH